MLAKILLAFAPLVLAVLAAIWAKRGKSPIMPRH